MNYAWVFGKLMFGLFLQGVSGVGFCVYRVLVTRIFGFWGLVIMGFRVLGFWVYVIQIFGLGACRYRVFGRAKRGLQVTEFLGLGFCMYWVYGNEGNWVYVLRLLGLGLCMDKGVK